MNLRKFVAIKEEYTFLIQQNAPSEWYLFIWEGKKCIRDYLQGGLEVCQDQALEEYEILLDIWKEIPSETLVDFRKPSLLRTFL